MRPYHPADPTAMRAFHALPAVALLAVLAAPALVRGADEWSPTLEKGLAAARKSGRPVFAVTLWKTGVCATCDAWRERVRPDADFRRQLQRFEPVEWLYDGLDGPVIKWTLANGGKSADPSAQLFVVGLDGKVLSRVDDAKVTTPAAVSAWMKEQADAWEKAHPRTALPVARATVTVEKSGETQTARCAEVDAARDEKRPLLLFFCREDDPSDKALRAEVSASRKAERALLDSKQVADAAAGVTALRFDLSDDAARAYAASLGVDRAPAILLWEPEAERPTKLPAALTAPDLAFRLRKLASAAKAEDKPK